MRADIFLAMKYDRLIMFIDEVAHEIGIAPGSARNQISAGEFPIATRKQGNRLIADVRDVGKYLDDCRDEAVMFKVATDRSEIGAVRKSRAKHGD